MLFLLVTGDTPRIIAATVLPAAAPTLLLSIRLFLSSRSGPSLPVLYGVRFHRVKKERCFGCSSPRIIARTHARSHNNLERVKEQGNPVWLFVAVIIISTEFFASCVVAVRPSCVPWWCVVVQPASQPLVCLFPFFTHGLLCMYMGCADGGNGPPETTQGDEHMVPRTHPPTGCDDRAKPASLMAAKSHFAHCCRHCAINV